MRHRVLAHIGLANLLYVLLLAIATFAFALPASAGAFVYWLSPEEWGIGRADLNGGGLEQPFVPHLSHEGYTGGLAVGGQRIYFAGSGGRIGRASLAGGGIERDFVTIPQPVPEVPYKPIELDASSLAVKGGYLYWCSAGSLIAKGVTSDNVGRVNLASNTVEPGFINTNAPVYMVRAYGNHIYWISEHAIVRADLDGGGVESHFIPLGSSQVYGLAVAEGHIYWATEHAIARANMDGRGLDQHLISSSTFFGGVAVGGGYIYWPDNEKREGESFDEKGWWIWRARLDGGAIRPKLIHVGSEATSFQVDAFGPGAVPTDGKHRKHHIKHR